MEYKYTGIILGKRDVGETDRIYTIYTLEGGKIKSLAKGVRKPHAKLASALENITLADVTIVRTRGLGKITGSIVENNFTSIKNDCDALLQTFGALNLFDKLVDFESPDQKVFGILKDYLEAIEEAKNIEKYILLKLGFTVKLLFELGYAIEVNSCVSCRKTLSKDSLYFSSEQGGVLCGECAKSDLGVSIPIRANAVKMIRLFLQNNMKALSKIQAAKEDADSASMIVEDFIRWQI